MPKIYIMNGPDKGRSFEVDERRFLSAGADKRNPREGQIRFPEDLKIVKRDEKYYVTDWAARTEHLSMGSVSPVEMNIRWEECYRSRQDVPVRREGYPEDVLAVLDSIDLFPRAR